MAPGFPATAWIYWISGGALALGGLILLYWSLLHDRARSRKRCPRCWYDMSGTPENVNKPGTFTCSECGKFIKRERRLYKTRRRWRCAIVAAMVCFGGAFLLLQPKVQHDGWWSLVPTRVLIAGLPFASHVDDFWCKELARRVQLSKGFRLRRFGPATGKKEIKLTKENWERFFDRCVQGDWRAQPVSDAWRRKYGELIHAWTLVPWQQEALPKSLEHKLLVLPPKLYVKYRNSWPIDVPFYVEFSLETWWSTDTLVRAEISPRILGASSFTVSELYAPCGFIAPADFRDDEIVFDIVTKFSRDGKSALDVAKSETVTVPVQRQGGLANHIKPVSSPAMDAAMSAMSFTISRGGLEPNSASTEIAMFKGIALGARFEYLLDGQVILTQSNWWTGGDSILMFRPGETHGDTKRLLRQAKSNENWTLRIRSDPQLALRVFDCNQYWQGEVTIPLTIGKE